MPLVSASRATTAAPPRPSLASCLCQARQYRRGARLFARPCPPACLRVLHTCSDHGEAIEVLALPVAGVEAFLADDTMGKSAGARMRPDAGCIHVQGAQACNRLRQLFNHSIAAALCGLKQPCARSWRVVAGAQPPSKSATSGGRCCPLLRLLHKPCSPPCRVQLRAPAGLLFSLMWLLERLEAHSGQLFPAAAQTTA